MRTSAKRASLLRTVELERELVELLADVERELYRAGAELDRFYAELEADVERDRRRTVRAAEREAYPAGAVLYVDPEAVLRA